MVLQLSPKVNSIAEVKYVVLFKSEAVYKCPPLAALIVNVVAVVNRVSDVELELFQIPKIHLNGSGKATEVPCSQEAAL